MADDQVYNYLTDLLSGTITRQAFWELAKFRHPTHQIAFCTKEALKCIKYVGAEKLGKDIIQKIYDLAEVYHSENIDKITQEIVEEAKIENGDYDIISCCKYNVPTHWDIGKVYKRLIIMVCDNDENKYIDTTIEVLSSWIIEMIDNYNSSMYYENPSYIYACYKENEIL